MNEQQEFPIEQVEEPQTLRQLLLVEKVHYTFETWFIKRVQSGDIPEDKPFTMRELRLEYLRQCWKEETLWKKWSENGEQ